MLRLACATLSADGFKTTTYDKTFDMLPKAGFEFVEFNLWAPVTMLSAKTSELKQRCAATGLTPAVVHSRRVSGTGETTVEVAYLVRLMEVAQELGCSRICFTGGQRANGSLAGAIEVLNQAAPAAEDKGVLICLENHANNTFESIEDYATICDAIASPSIGICLDTGHFAASDVDMDALIDRLGERVNHIHLKQNRGVGKADFTRFGEGTTDMGHVVERMIERGYDGYMSVELSPQKDRESTVEDLATAHRMFAKYETVPERA